MCPFLLTWMQLAVELGFTSHQQRGTKQASGDKGGDTREHEHALSSWSVAAYFTEPFYLTLMKLTVLLSCVMIIVLTRVRMFNHRLAQQLAQFHLLC